MFVVGPFGVGKSLFINYLLEHSLGRKDFKEGDRAVLEDCIDLDVAPSHSFAQIGHTKKPQTLFPDVFFHPEPNHANSYAYCDCPGLGAIDSRWPEASVAGMVGMRSVLQRAESARFVILANYETLKPQANRAKGLLDLSQICFQIFGDAANLEKHSNALLLGIMQVPPGQKLRKVRSWLSEDASPILNILSERLFFYDPLDKGGRDFWKRDECSKCIAALQPVHYGSSLFRNVLTEGNEQWLQILLENQSQEIQKNLSNKDYRAVALCWKRLGGLRSIDNSVVERTLDFSKVCIASHFSHLEMRFWKACLNHDLPSANELLNVFQETRSLFGGNIDWLDLSEPAALRKYYKESLERTLTSQESLDKLKRGVLSQVESLGDELAQYEKALREELKRDEELCETNVSILEQERDAAIRRKEKRISMLLELGNQDISEILRLEKEKIDLKLRYTTKIQAIRYEESSRLRSNYQTLLSEAHQTKEANNLLTKELGELLKKYQIKSDKVRVLETELIRIQEEEEQRLIVEKRVRYQRKGCVTNGKKKNVER